MTDKVSNHAEAISRMLAWANGERSHWNEFLAVEASSEQRTQTLAALAVADAAEVVKWSAVAQAFPDLSYKLWSPPTDD